MTRRSSPYEYDERRNARIRQLREQKDAGLSTAAGDQNRQKDKESHARSSHSFGAPFIRPGFPVCSC